jgi:enoyl-CoA hydratase
VTGIILRREDRGAVRILTIDRPAVRNALNTALIEELDRGFAEAAGDGAVRTLVLTAAGDKAFCAGMDLKEFRCDGCPRPRRSDHFYQFKSGQYPKPVVAAVNGAAVGGGLELVLACDVAICAAHARLGLPEITHGLLPAGGGLDLVRRIPRAVAAEVTLTGTLINARRAYEHGLVNQVVDGERVLADATDLAARIAAHPPEAVLEARRLMQLALGDHRRQLGHDVAGRSGAGQENPRATNGPGCVGEAGGRHGDRRVRAGGRRRPGDGRAHTETTSPRGDCRWMIRSGRRVRRARSGRLPGPVPRAPRSRSRTARRAASWLICAGYPARCRNRDRPAG